MILNLINMHVCYLYNDFSQLFKEGCPHKKGLIVIFQADSRNTETEKSEGLDTCSSLKQVSVWQNSNFKTISKEKVGTSLVFSLGY